MLWLLITDQRLKELFSHPHLDNSVLSKAKQEEDVLIKHTWTLYLAPLCVLRLRYSWTSQLLINVQNSHNEQWSEVGMMATKSTGKKIMFIYDTSLQETIAMANLLICLSTIKLDCNHHHQFPYRKTSYLLVCRCTDSFDAWYLFLSSNWQSWIT